MHLLLLPLPPDLMATLTKFPMPLKALSVPILRKTIPMETERVMLMKSAGFRTRLIPAASPEVLRPPVAMPTATAFRLLWKLSMA